jgi:hypothetical protein
MKQPAGDLEIVIKNTNDAGGIRHVALEVSDAVDRYTNQLTVKNHLGTFITKDTPIPLDPFGSTSTASNGSSNKAVLWSTMKWRESQDNAGLCQYTIGQFDSADDGSTQMHL